MFADRAERIRSSHPVEKVRIDRDTVIGEGAIGRRDAPVRRSSDYRDFESVLLCEIIVALILARRRHDRAGAVAHQHVVGDPDRYVFVRKWIMRISAGENAGLLLDRRK